MPSGSKRRRISGTAATRSQRPDAVVRVEPSQSVPVVRTPENDVAVERCADDGRRALEGETQDVLIVDFVPRLDGIVVVSAGDVQVEADDTSPAACQNVVGGTEQRRYLVPISRSNLTIQKKKQLFYNNINRVNINRVTGTLYLHFACHQCHQDFGPP